MRKVVVATVLAAALLASASSAPAAEIGANDDTGKYEPDAGTSFYADMVSLGLRQIVLTTRYEPSDPLTIQDKEYLDRTIPAAVAAGLRVVLDVYPYPPREVEAGLASPAAFGAYVAAVATAFPDVTQFVVGNEPNQPAFWRPQFAADGSNASAPAFGPYLAAAYDALKVVDPAISVIGIGLSPRGNDRPDAKNNISTSPVRFIRALGAWYRASGRTRAADGRIQLPSVSQQGDRPPRPGLSLAERGIRQPRSDQAGAVGRLPRDGAADDDGRAEASSR